jgi:hypothetical protein
MAPLEDGASGLEDDEAGARVVGGRLQMSGHVVLAPSTPPSGATPVTLINDTPLELTSAASPSDVSRVITNGTTFYVQHVVAGAAASPVAAGSVIEVIFDDGTEHIVARAYVQGFTNIVTYPDLCEARDGTALTGNGTNTIIVRRRRLSAQALELEGVLTGYEV